MNTVAKNLIKKGWQSSHLGERLINNKIVYKRKSGIQINQEGAEIRKYLAVKLVSVK